MSIILNDYVDKIVVMTERKPRDKVNVTAYEHRKNMIQRAIADMTAVDFLEVEDATFSLAATMQKIKKVYGTDNKFSFIMGVDVFERIDQWRGNLSDRSFADVLNDLRFLIALRTEDDGEIAIGVRSRLGLVVELIVSQLPDVSSSKIRHHVDKHKQFPSLHPDVLQYIQANGLY